ncbi:hypothetical protein JTB14_021416 [Gonioctena quinquepunctata]|nr:hypothetical protein JTB14_021416 [Gonioctena quinquepunctata]
MVSNQKGTVRKKITTSNQKNEQKKSFQTPSDPLESLEKEITEVVSACESLVKSGRNTIGKKATKLTLETVAQDMSNILSSLKFNLNSFREKVDSFSDVLPILEESVKTQIKLPPTRSNNNDTEQQTTDMNKQHSSVMDTIAAAKNSKLGNRNKHTLPISDKSEDGKTNPPNINRSGKTRPSTAGAKLPNSTLLNTTTKEGGKTKGIKEKPQEMSSPSSSNRAKANIHTTNDSSSNRAKTNMQTSNDPSSNRAKTNMQMSNDSKNLPVVKKITIPDKRATKTAPPISKNRLPENFSNVSWNIDTKPRNSLSAQSGTRNVIQLPQINVVKELKEAPACSLGSLQAEVDRAITARKTFTIRGNYGGVRRALLKRGWVEKIHFTLRDQINKDINKFRSYSIPELVSLIGHNDVADICRRLIKSKLLANHQVDLYYGPNFESYKECPDKEKETLINRIRWTSFSYTNKQGLCEAARKSFWFNIPGVSNLNHPRSYKLTKNGETEEFIKDFNITAAMSLLKWVKIVNTTGQCKIMSPSGKIPLSVFDFAINECYKLIKRAKHEDIDIDIEEAVSKEWSDFLEYYYRTVHVGNHFKQAEDVSENDLVRKANFILDRLKNHWPYLEMDGLMNIWILKPTHSSQGVGIHMCRTLKYVLDVVKANPNRRYIIQKYIERPLLIYNTKFDIRQWFLISSCLPLTIWIYKHCYLRFSSQTYNLRKLHESIHLTNNSVQSRYSRLSKDITLPSYNMWDSNQLKNYLSNVGFPKVFDDIIFPGMKECITAAVLMHQECVDQRKNSFELYGADFIVTEDFKPWLLEINSNPALFASTPITAKMCPQVLEDVIKGIKS